MEVRAIEVIRQFRREVADPEMPGSDVSGVDPDADSLWKTDELLDYLDEAHRKTARDAYLFTENYSLSVSAEQDEVQLPTEVFDVRLVRLQSSRRPLAPRNLNEAVGTAHDDYGHHSVAFFDDSVGEPSAFILDYRPGYIKLVPKPAEADTLELNAYREPKDKLSTKQACLDVVSPQHQRAILYWMKKLAYEKQDADAMDLDRAMMFEQHYIRTIDTLKSEHRRETRRPGTVRYGGL